MTIMGKFIAGMLSVVGLIAFSIPTFGAEGSGGGKQDAQTSQQQRSDKMQQDQQGSDTQGGKQSPNTGADLTSGRDSHLGPQDAKGSQTQKKK